MAENHLAGATSRRQQLEKRMSELLSRLTLSRVYVIYCATTGLHKIGITNDIVSRFAQLQGASSYPLEIRLTYSCAKGSERVFESILHGLFSDRRTHGEWFKLTTEDLFFLSSKTPLRLLLDRDSMFDDHTVAASLVCPPVEHYHKFSSVERSPTAAV